MVVPESNCFSFISAAVINFPKKQRVLKVCDSWRQPITVGKSRQELHTGSHITSQPSSKTERNECMHACLLFGLTSHLTVFHTLLLIASWVFPHQLTN